MRLTRTNLFAAIAAVFLLVAAYRVGRARADGAPTMNPLYFGGVLDDGGRPVEGMRSITVRLWDAATGGAAVCTTASPTTTVTAGRWRVTLDAACATAVQTNPNLWAEVSVDGNAFPRSKVGAVPYALEARRAAGASGALATRIAAVETAATPRQVVVGEYAPDMPGGNVRIEMPSCPSIVTTMVDLWRIYPIAAATLRFVASSSSLYRVGYFFGSEYGSSRLRFSPPVPRAFVLGGGVYYSLTAGTSYTITIEYQVPMACNSLWGTTATQSAPILVEQVN
jgi:hypothetical protein